MATAVKFDKQKILNRVAKHLLKQGEKCQTAKGACKYKGQEGDACAVGCLIPASLYTPYIENVSIRALLDYNTSANNPTLAVCRGGTKKHALKRILETAVGAKTNRDFMFLKQLQEVHDCIESYQWGSALKALAKDHQLMCPSNV